MNKTLKKLSIVAAALPLVLVSAASNATTEIATFSDKTASQFIFTNQGTSASFTSVSDPVAFNFTIAGLDAALQGTQNAHLSYSVSTTAQAMNVGFLGDVQPMNSVTTISIVRDTAYNTFTNLLTATFSGGTLANQPFMIGGIGSSSLTESAGSGTGSGQSVTFTSDFLNFGGALHNDVGLSFTGLSSPVGINLDGFLNSFTATGSGNFSTDSVSVVAVPEPEAYAMLLAGLGLIGFMVRHRKTS